MKLTAAQRGVIERTPADILRVPFTDAGCVLHRSHRPVPASSELHHVYPLYLQAVRWPEVDPNRPSTAQDKERVPICGSGHSDVHYALDDELNKRPRRRGVGRAELALAREAIRRFTA